MPLEMKSLEEKPLGADRALGLLVLQTAAGGCSVAESSVTLR